MCSKIYVITGRFVIMIFSEVWRVEQCYLFIKDNVGRLPRGERSVGEYILASPEAVTSMSIGELASACGTSKATVVRFCKAVGCRGFKELCARLHADVAVGRHRDLTYSDIHPCDGTESIIASVGDNAIGSIRNTLANLDREALEKAVDAIGRAGRVDFYGVGFSGFIALDAQNKFLRIGKFSACQTDAQLATLTAMNLAKNDVAVMISYTGETKDIIELTRRIRETGATTVSITKSGGNTLSTLTDLNLHTVSGEGFIRSGAMSSRIGQLTMIDIIFTLVVSRNFQKFKPSLDKTAEAIREKKTQNLKW